MIFTCSPSTASPCLEKANLPLLYLQCSLWRCLQRGWEPSYHQEPGLGRRNLCEATCGSAKIPPLTANKEIWGPGSHPTPFALCLDYYCSWGGWLNHFQYEPQFSIISSLKQGFSEHVCSPIPMILYFQLGHNHTFQQTMKSPDKWKRTKYTLHMTGG